MDSDTDLHGTAPVGRGILKKRRVAGKTPGNEQYAGMGCIRATPSSACAGTTGSSLRPELLPGLRRQVGGRPPSAWHRTTCR